MAKLQEEAKNVHLQTFDEAKAEIGDLAQSDEDVLSYALFPNEARALFEKRAAGTLRDITQPIDADAAAPAATDTEEDTDMNVSQIRDLIEALDGSSVAEVTIKDGTTEVAIKKPVAVTAAAAVAAPAPAEPAPAAAAAPAPTAAAEPAAPAAPAATDRPAGWKAVESPMVGTFYQAPAPDADPFVKVGDEVKVGQTLCIVEAMKLMNEITAEEDGIVREVCGKNGEPVEFGEPLFYLEPTA